AALQLIADLEPQMIDVGVVNDRPFINMVTGGFGTQVTVETSQELKKVLGGAAYFLTGLNRFSSISSQPGRFQGPDFEWQGNFMVLAIGNGRQAGGGHVMCPEASIDDGLLDVSILREPPNSEELPVVMNALMEKGIEGVKEMAIVTAKVPWLELETDDAVYLNLDGEPEHGTHFRFQVLPGLLGLHLPVDSPVIKTR
ncbi:MAG: YegS/Rv2252/BmrU family lipid kinase, partial [Gammaproteobacteria bacterium]